MRHILLITITLLIIVGCGRVERHAEFPVVYESGNEPVTSREVAFKTPLLEDYTPQEKSFLNIARPVEETSSVQPVGTQPTKVLTNDEIFNIITE